MQRTAQWPGATISSARGGSLAERDLDDPANLGIGVSLFLFAQDGDRLLLAASWQGEGSGGLRVEAAMYQRVAEGRQVPLPSPDDRAHRRQRSRGSCRRLPLERARLKSDGSLRLLPVHAAECLQRTEHDFARGIVPQHLVDAVE